jgi:hypothetical protein
MNLELTTKAVIVMGLRDFENIELAALHLAIRWGRITENNVGYKKALDYGYIREDGSIESSMKEPLASAIEYEVGKRISAETYNMSSFAEVDMTAEEMLEIVRGSDFF